jgi:hypothetical protein
LCGQHLGLKRGGTKLLPENVEFLQGLGITYRQWNYWHRMGWVTGSFKDADTDRLRLLAKASKMQSMPLNELADLLREKEIA